MSFKSYWDDTMTRHRVIVKGGGANLYYVNESNGRFFVIQKRVGLILDSDTDIGKTRAFEDALGLIRSHSGRGIDSID